MSRVIKQEVVTVVEVDLSPMVAVLSIEEVNVGDNIVYTKGRGNEGEEGVGLSRAVKQKTHASSGATSFELEDGCTVNFTRIRAILPDVEAGEADADE